MMYICAVALNFVLTFCVASLAHADGEPLEHVVIIDAPVGDVWAAMTTSEGIESWMAPHAELDLRVGGKMRTNYHADGEIGDANTIANTIVAMEPLLLFAVRASELPVDFPYPEAIKRTWSEIHFESLSGNRTRVRCVVQGFGDDEESVGLRAFFDAGNAWTLNKLKEYLTPKHEAARNKSAAEAKKGGEAETVFVAIARPGPNWVPGKSPQGQPGFDEHVAFLASLRDKGALLAAGPFGDQQGGMALLRAGFLAEAKSMIEHGAFAEAGVIEWEVRAWMTDLSGLASAEEAPASAPAGEADRVMASLHRWVGGEWIHEQTTDDGAVFRSRNVIEVGPDGESLIARGWVGDASGMSYHGHSQIWRAPGTGAVWFQNIDEKGTVARGRVRPEGDSGVAWDWVAHTRDGSRTVYHVVTMFDDDASYRMALYRNEAGEQSKLFEIPFRRVAAAPDAFLRMRGEGGQP